jgi:hypothetical protein
MGAGGQQAGPNNRRYGCDDGDYHWINLLET